MDRSGGPACRCAGRVAVVLCGTVGLVGCGQGGDPVSVGGAEPRAATSSPPTVTDAAPTPTDRRSTPSGSVTLAFAGDTHFEGSSAAALDAGLGSGARPLREADLAVVNLETAVTTRGAPQPKAYTFRAPPAAFDALRRAGVDAVSMANNHGMDFGRPALLDSLAAARRAEVAVVGAGRTAGTARAPWRRTVHGVRVSVFAATDVLDPFAISSWTATADRAGLVSAKGDGLARLVAAVRAERSRADLVVVFLHWGLERQRCPTGRQREVAQALVDAGVDAVVGSHAHVLQPQRTVDGTFIAYGLGNFVFYARGGATAASGVLTLTVTSDGVASSRWRPSVIRSGRPRLLTGADRRQGLAAQRALDAAC